MDTIFTIRNISNDASTANISDFGAHVIDWAPAGQSSVVWRPKALQLTPTHAIRGGVPVIFPWFAKGYEYGQTANKNPKHGPARTTIWRYDTTSPSDQTIRYTLDSTSLSPNALAQLNAGDTPRFHAVYEVTAAAELDMTLTVTNDGDEALTYENALHTYFHVDDVEDTELRGLAGTHYLDATQPGMPECVQNDDTVTFNGETVDRIYLAHHDVTLHDPRLRRDIIIRPQGSDQTVVWNPGAHDGNALGDIAPGEWRNFVCVEAVSCRDHAVVLQPGESHTLRQTIAVIEL